MGNRQELVIYGGNRQQLARPGQARLTQGHTSPLGLITGGHENILYLYRKSQMLFVGESELELALWATEYLPPHRYLRFPTVIMNFTANYGYVT